MPGTEKNKECDVMIVVVGKAQVRPEVHEAAMAGSDL